MSTPVLRVGILGATDTAQATYLPILHSDPTHFHLSIIYDPNPEVTQHCQAQFKIPYRTSVADDVLRHAGIDLVLNLLPMEDREQYTVAALKAGKHVMVEAPLSLSIPGWQHIRGAIKKRNATTATGVTTQSNGDTNNSVESKNNPKIFVSCAYRYAPCFTEVFKKELASLDRIYYARCRNIAGAPSINPRPTTNGNKPTKNGTNGAATNPNTTAQFRALLADVFGGPEEDLTPDRAAFCRFLGTRGGHDLSLMRECLGLPDAVSSVSITVPFYSVVFHYTDTAGQGQGHPFTLLYEAGVDGVPRCDAHLTIYGANKTISVQYDFPCPGEVGSIEGLCVRVVVEEAEPDTAVCSGHGHINGNGHGNGIASSWYTDSCARVKRTEIVSSADDAYRQELAALYSYLVEGNTAGKTDAGDALMDLRLLRLIFEHYNRQCGTIRTPLG
ncbi:hypothetical protein NUU61_002659 [Penicillium alfredii]|uniref:Gfo/Idh/MocA-like oxidoreductase N-terminal domain-containing protein n=1 Tax=Penicillium alfredii TaxID=1506179 RepID=A0A9W9FS40_9EURO|nr:uncharacterized protein NUU61_002659 [Penicillium alfredii]KAJ5105312.1 hypothetical protein NUU61_002659 [Penicillium alfredii]